MKTKRIIAAAVLFSLMAGTAVIAQGLEDNVSVYTSANGKRYLQPLADAFGANLNSGFFRTAKIKKFGLSLEFGIKAMYAPIPDEKKLFTLVEDEIAGVTWTPAYDQEVATVFGPEGSQTAFGMMGVDIETPGGAIDTDFFPLAVPQLTVGAIFGTEVTLRYLKYKINDEIGEIMFWGWGIRHNLSQYIPLCPVDIAAGYYHQTFEIGNMITAGATYYGFQASKKISILTLYGAIGMEKSNLDISYTQEGAGGAAVAFNLEGENNTRTTIGFSLDLSVLKLHADYSIAAQNVITAGIGFGI